jgi:hypothetical protein
MSRTALDLLKGHSMLVMTDVKVEVKLIIDKVESIPNSRDLALPTRENDWYPPQETWESFRVHFTNGHTKEYRSIEDIKITM